MQLWNVLMVQDHPETIHVETVENTPDRRVDVELDLPVTVVGHVYGVNEYHALAAALYWYGST